MLLTAAQHAYDPAEQDDGNGHAYEADSHPLEVCKGTREGAAFVGAMPSASIVISSDYEKAFWALTERVPLILPYRLREVDWQVSGER